MAKPSIGGSASTSSLSSGEERFLSQVVSHALENGYRSPEDFLRAFKPLELMESLESAPELRKDILVMAGMHEKIARRKTTESAADDLRLALDEGVTTAADVLDVLSADDRVRYLNRTKLFAFAVEEGSFGSSKTGTDHERALDRLLFILETAVSERLVQLADVASSIGFDTIAQRLPLKDLQRALQRALVMGSRGEAFSDNALFEIVPLRTLLGYVPLEQVWNKVIVAKVLEPARLVDSDARASSAPPESARPDASPSSRRAAGREPPPKPAPVNGKKPVEEPKKPALDVRSSEHDVDSLLEATDGPARTAAPEEEARKKVVDRLQAIKRLPPGHAELSTPILLSIDSMYAELLDASTDEAREDAIRDSFPNEQHMAQALLALIELLDPSIDINDPVIRDADIDSLIKVVLFEERHRYEQSHPSQRPAASAVLAAPPPPSGQTAVPPLPPPARRTTPPPLPRSASPSPPPLPPSANADKSR